MYFASNFQVYDLRMLKNKTADWVFKDSDASSPFDYSFNFCGRSVNESRCSNGVNGATIVRSSGDNTCDRLANDVDAADEVEAIE